MIFRLSTFRNNHIRATGRHGFHPVRFDYLFYACTMSLNLWRHFGLPFQHKDFPTFNETTISTPYYHCPGLTIGKNISTELQDGLQHVAWIFLDLSSRFQFFGIWPETMSYGPTRQFYNDQDNFVISYFIMSCTEKHTCSRLYYFPIVKDFLAL